MENRLIHLWKTDCLLIRLLCVVILISWANVEAGAQQKKVERAIKGVVLDSDTNEPLIGVNITFKEIKTGTITDVDGNFSLPIDKQRKVYNLVFSYIEMCIRDRE